MAAFINEFLKIHLMTDKRAEMPRPRTDEKVRYKQDHHQCLFCKYPILTSYQEFSILVVN